MAMGYWAKRDDLRQASGTLVEVLDKPPKIAEGLVDPSPQGDAVAVLSSWRGRAGADKISFAQPRERNRHGPEFPQHSVPLFDSGTLLVPQDTVKYLAKAARGNEVGDATSSWRCPAPNRARSCTCPTSSLPVEAFLRETGSRRRGPSRASSGRKTWSMEWRSARSHSSQKGALRQRNKIVDKNVGVLQGRPIRRQGGVAC